MLIGGYEIPRRVLGFIALLLAAALAAVYLLVIRDNESGSTNESQVTTPVVSGTGKVGTITGPKLVVTLKGKEIKGYSVFVTLTPKAKGSQPVWTQRLTADEPLGASLAKGDFIVSFSISPCQDDCDVFHGGIGLAPVAVKGGEDAALTLAPDCRKIKGAPGLDCGASKVTSQ